MKTAVITGASDGLGLAIAKSLKEKGWQVYSLSRNKPDIDIYHIKTDLTNHNSISDAADILNKQSIDLLINNAGVSTIEPNGKITSRELDRVFDTNIRGAILLTSMLFENLKKSEADIVNVASTVGQKAQIGQAAYGASKMAMRGYSANLQLELVGTKCRVISFCTGGMVTEMFKKIDGRAINDPENWMDPSAIATALISLIELPKNVEVSEIFINRKKLV